MKAVNFKTTILIAAIGSSGFFVACNEAGNQKEQAETISDKEMKNVKQEETKMEVLLAVYMDMKNAMVADDADMVQEKAKEMMKIKDMMSDEVRTSVSRIAQTSNIKEQRKHFAVLSEQLYQEIKDGENIDKTLYWNHCGMALNNAGANWLSYEEKISNPYMGQKMPKCGKVEEVIKN